MISVVFHTMFVKVPHGLFCVGQFVMGQCEMNSTIGDMRMCQLALLGEVLDNVSLEEMVSYNGQFPLWKRIMVAIRRIRVRLVGLLLYLFGFSAGAHRPHVMQSFVIICFVTASVARMYRFCLV